MLRGYVKALLSTLGYEISRARRPSCGEVLSPYTENPEFGPVNISAKLARAESGGPFEWPDVVALNEAAKQLIREERRIAEFGCGTGKFMEIAKSYPDRFFFASEFDRDTLEWTRNKLKDLENITWFVGPIPEHLGRFDLLVALDVIEHVANFPAFLELAARTSGRAIISTPNRARQSSANHAGPPRYEQHVREWTAGEFFWVLRCYWDDVCLYSTATANSSKLVRIDVNSTSYHLIADCNSPRTPK